MNLDTIFKNMENMAGGAKLTLPPNSFIEMDGKVIDYIDGKSIKVSFPVYEKYNNPAGIMLGGFLPVFFDLSFGPLSYLVAKKPTSSLDLNTTFIKPVTAKDKEIIIDAKVVNHSKSYLILEAEAFNNKDVLVGKSTSRMLIFNS
ncbi:MAG: PaaI family thioesterase [Desulfobacterales bacterium]|nr:PaaI family thioesterase [Desulfobacterales bacterium]MCP4162895.1 PaaI family thioesterase [Deltaproteobacteria bacterium]